LFLNFVLQRFYRLSTMHFSQSTLL
jgi:hypothetical protein